MKRGGRTPRNGNNFRREREGERGNKRREGERRNRGEEIFPSPLRAHARARERGREESEITSLPTEIISVTKRRKRKREKRERERQRRGERETGERKTPFVARREEGGEWRGRFWRWEEK